MHWSELSKKFRLIFEVTKEKAQTYVMACHDTSIVITLLNWRQYEEHTFFVPSNASAETASYPNKLLMEADLPVPVIPTTRAVICSSSSSSFSASS